MQLQLYRFLVTSRDKAGRTGIPQSADVGLPVRYPIKKPLEVFPQAESHLGFTQPESVTIELDKPITILAIDSLNVLKCQDGVSPR